MSRNTNKTLHTCRLCYETGKRIIEITKVCPTCNGKGRKITNNIGNKQTNNGRKKSIVCQRCQGNKTIVKYRDIGKCKQCKGIGTTNIKFNDQSCNAQTEKEFKNAIKEIEIKKNTPLNHKNKKVSQQSDNTNKTKKREGLDVNDSKDCCSTHCQLLSKCCFIFTGCS